MGLHQPSIAGLLKRLEVDERQGAERTILAVPKYDFNWQTYYMFNEPLHVPKGARIVSTAWYDNSAADRHDPDPSKGVTWGDQTWEEMQYSGILVSAADR